MAARRHTCVCLQDIKAEVESHVKAAGYLVVAFMIVQFFSMALAAYYRSYLIQNEDNEIDAEEQAAYHSIVRSSQRRLCCFVGCCLCAHEDVLADLCLCVCVCVCVCVRASVCLCEWQENGAGSRYREKHVRILVPPPHLIRYSRLCVRVCALCVFVLHHEQKDLYEKYNIRRDADSGSGRGSGRR